MAAGVPSEQELDWMQLCRESLVPLAPWRYQPGDDPRFAEPEWTDTQWARAWTFFRTVAPPPGWSERGWFRTRVEVPDHLRGRALTVYASYIGSFELFVDGRLVASRGSQTPRSVTEHPVGHAKRVGTVVLQSPFVDLALRVTTPLGSVPAGLGPVRGVALDFCDSLEGSRVTPKIESIRVSYTAFIGFILSLATLHIFLFFSVSERQTGHFDYAVFSVATAGLSICVYGRSLSGTLFEVWGWSLGFLASLIVLSTFGVRFLAGTAFGPRHWVRRRIVFIGAPLLLAVPWLTVQAGYIYSMGCLMVDTLIAASMLRGRDPDRFIVMVGVVAMHVAAAVQMLPILMGTRLEYPTAFIYGFTIFSLAMSLTLARSVGRTHGALRERVHEVQALSEAHLAEQDRAQQAALERVALEAENRQQAERLVEADRRSVLLEELKDANRKLRETQAQLVQSEKMVSLGQLVAGVAHEMNTPIGAIHSVHGSLRKAVDKLRERLGSIAPGALEDRKLKVALDVLDDGAQVVARGSERVSEIVQRLRTFARLDEAELQHADVHEGLEDTLILARHELKHGIELVRDFGEIPRMTCYPGLLNQVFLNLVINARQAMATKGRLTVTTLPKAGGVEVRFTDTGPGIRPEHLAKVFDPGFTTKGVGVGTGLGLAICYRLIEAHHGRIWAESNFGEGATFALWLPGDLEERLEQDDDRQER